MRVALLCGSTKYLSTAFCPKKFAAVLNFCFMLFIRIIELFFRIGSDKNWHPLSGFFSKRFFLLQCRCKIALFDKGGS